MRGWAWSVVMLAGVGMAQTRVVIGPGSVGAAAQGAAVPAAVDADKEKMRRQLADWPQLGRYAAANKALEAKIPGRVVFYGDSITDAWANPTNAALFFPGKPYVGRGISGQTTPQMLLRFRQDVIDLHPDAVVILAGINDIAGNTGPMTQEMTKNNLMMMAELAKAHGIRVLLCSILPGGDIPWRHGLNAGSAVIALNAWMKEYAAKEGFVYVDYWTAMANPAGTMKDGLSSDGVHPTAAGYTIMGPLVEAAIEAK